MKATPSETKPYSLAEGGGLPQKNQNQTACRNFPLLLTESREAESPGNCRWMSLQHQPVLRSPPVCQTPACQIPMAMEDQAPKSNPLPPTGVATGEEVGHPYGSSPIRGLEIHRRGFFHRGLVIHGGVVTRRGLSPTEEDGHPQTGGLGHLSNFAYISQPPGAPP